MFTISSATEILIYHLTALTKQESMQDSVLKMILDKVKKQSNNFLNFNHQLLSVQIVLMVKIYNYGLIMLKLNI